MVELSPLWPDCPSLALTKETVLSFTHLDVEVEKRRNDKSSARSKRDKTGMSCRYRELLWPVLQQSVMQSLCGVRLGGLCGPTLINAEKEDIYRLCDCHLHVHLHTFFTSSFQKDTNTNLIPIWSNWSVKVDLPCFWVQCWGRYCRPWCTFGQCTTSSVSLHRVHPHASPSHCGPSRTRQGDRAQLETLIKAAISIWSKVFSDRSAQ